MSHGGQSAETQRPTLKGVARWVGAGIVGGLISGFLVGGLGGRLAMFLLRVTSDPAVMGLKSDDGFIIGRFSASTAFLLLFCAAMGAVGGVCYLLFRDFLPDRFRARLTGLLAALAIGSIVIHPGGVDFTRLSPRWLAVSLFVLLPSLYGVAMSRLVENLGRRTSNRLLPWTAVLGLLTGPPAMGFTGSLLVPAVLFIAAVLILLSVRIDAISRFYATQAMSWTGRAALTAVGAFSAALLVKDALTIL